MMTSRRIRSAVAAFGGCFLVLLSTALHPAQARQAHSPCVVVIAGPPLTCLGASERARVHALFPAAIDPTPWVRSVSGLRFATANVIYNRQHHVIAVQFYYGAAHAYHTVPPIAARPRFLMVAESVGPLDYTVRLWDANTRWGHYRGPIPHRNMSLVVFGNVRQRVVQRIVREVLASFGRA